MFVHHFRPTSNAYSDQADDSSAHHYAWFAYEWRNFYAACADCNRSKGSKFPVAGTRAPLLCSLDEARALESGTLLDPCYDDPDKHLTLGWNGVSHALTNRGGATVLALALNRPDLVERRLRASREFQKVLAVVVQEKGRHHQLYEHLSDERPYVAGLTTLLQNFTEELAEVLGRAVPRYSDRISRLTELLGEATEDDLANCFRRISELSAAPLSPSDGSYFDGPQPLGSPRMYEVSAKPPVAADVAVSRIEVRNFKAIEKLTFELSERQRSVGDAACLMLLGENAAGKSSVLEAVALCLLGPESASELGIMASYFLRRKDPSRWLMVDAEPVEIRIRLHGIASPIEFHIDPIRQVFEGSLGATIPVLGYGPRRFFSRAGRRSRKAAARVRSLFDPMFTIAHPGRWLSSLAGSEFEAVARAIREILSLHVDDEIVLDPQLGICVRASGLLTPLDRMSDGYKSLFAMSVDIIRELLNHWRNLEEAQGVVLIDEIETHLHPLWKMRVMSSLRKALPKVTFIATTHDPLSLRGLDDGEVQVLHRDENQNIDRLRDLPSIKGLRAEQLLTSDYFGLSSTADAGIEAKLVDYAGAIANADRDPGGTEEIRRVGEELTSTLTIGDTAVEQIVQEAIKEYLDSRRGAPSVVRSEARRNAVAAVLNAIKIVPRA